MVSIKTFLSRINYTPKFISRDLDGCIMVQFRDFVNYAASLEFGTVDIGDGFQDVYFEIIDLRGYRAGNIIPLDSPSRKRVIHIKMNTENMDFAASWINDSLNMLYSKRFSELDL